VKYLVYNKNLPAPPLRWIWEIKKLALMVLASVAAVVILIVLADKL
jgi:hypothetical protein